MTAASATAGWPISVFSSSTDEIHSPPDLITSFARSLIWTKPRGCDRDDVARPEPAVVRPATRILPVAKYAEATHGPRTSSSPIASPSHGSSLAVVAATRSSTNGSGMPCDRDAVELRLLVGVPRGRP